MAGSVSFDWVCEQLEQATSLDRLEARGTVRLALKQAGLEAKSVSAGEMKVVLEKVLPGELTSRGIDEAGLCSRLAGAVMELEDDGPVESPEAVFKRLGGGS
ncbi:MAG: hypothetical protein MJE66_13500 [Proteobacteria bacterium]|nr:hypothetical protein [Pseudomonadota bacterium]